MWQAGHRPPFAIGAVVHLLVPVCLWAGCTPDVEGFTLLLEPNFVDSGSVLDIGPEIKLVQLLPDGEQIVSYMGTAARGTEIDIAVDLPLPAGSTLGLLAEAPNSQGDLWRPRQTLAYGQAVLTEELIDGEHILPMFVAEASKISELDAAAPARRRWRGAAVVVPGHGPYLFGGGDPEDVRVNSKGVLKLGGLDAGDTKFQNVGDIPSFMGALYGYEIEIPRRVGMGATVVEQDGQPLILVTGGREDARYSIPDVAGWFLWDPATDTVVDQGQMGISRSAHLAIRFDEGNVLLYGGFTSGSASVIPTYEIWNARNGRFDLGDEWLSITAGRFQAMASPFGRDVVVCGGMNPNFSFGADVTWRPVADCNRIKPNGAVSSFPSLPMPLAGGAMSPLPDGGLIVTGGVFAPFDERWDPLDGFYANTEAVSNTFYYDPALDSWRGAGHMATPRAHHRHVPLVDGRLMIVGGTGTGTAEFGPVTDPVRCPEIYDHNGDVFTLADCTDVGQGAWPLVAWAPGEETLIVEGGWDDLGTTGGSDYGVMTLGPPL